MKSQVCATFDGVCVVQIIKCGSQFRWICISVHLGQTMNWIICGFMEVNMGDAADESMKTHISKRRSNDDYNVLGHPTFLKVYVLILRKLRFMLFQKYSTQREKSNLKQ